MLQTQPITRDAAAGNPAADSRPFMSVKQVAEYLNLNEKKVYALVNEGKIPGTKITGKWMFPRELVDRWILESSHGGVLTDRLIIAGSDDPLLYRISLQFANQIKSHALISYTATGTRLGLDLLQANRVDACGLHWGPVEESLTRHPALLRQYATHPQWLLVRAFHREQGLMLDPGSDLDQYNAESLVTRPLRWFFRQDGAGAQRFLREFLMKQRLVADQLDVHGTALSEREAASAVAMGLADIAPGTRGAAREFNLGFVPLGWEAFDIALSRGVFFRRLFQDLLQRIQSKPTRAHAELLGGYDFTDCGRILWGDH